MSDGFLPFGHPSPMLDHLGDLRRHADDGARFGFVVDEPKLNGRRLLHAGAMSTIADVVIGHSLGASTSPPARSSRRRWRCTSSASAGKATGWTSP